MFNRLTAAACAAGLALGGALALTSATAGAAEDPFLWLEEVEGDRALEWVEAQNARSLAELEGDARFPALFDAAKTILQKKQQEM